MCTVSNPDIKNERIVSTFMGRDPFTEKKCINCPYIPLCGGGCLEQRIVMGENACNENRYIYESIVRREIEKSRILE